jgi:hypothetical protein
MTRSINLFGETHPSSGSDGALSSLGEFNTFTFGPTTDTPLDPRDAEDEDECDDVDTHESAYTSPDPRDIHELVVDATSYTSRLIAVRIGFVLCSSCPSD